MSLVAAFGIAAGMMTFLAGLVLVPILRRAMHEGDGEGRGGSPPPSIGGQPENQPKI